MNELSLELIKGKKYRIIIDDNKAITPPNLLGIDRKIAYANRKYHSGWMWIGVTIGFAGIKLSGSLNIYGYSRLIHQKKKRKIINPRISLIVK